MKNRPASRSVAPSYRPKQAPSLPPCQHACPNCGDIRGWIGVVAQAHKTGVSKDQAFETAWRTITAVNPFPATLGRICPHPCESHCNRGDKDEALAINAMERFLGDYAIEKKLSLPVSGNSTRPESIGVVGAGPSGLSFAYQMRRRGYDVTVYDGRDKPGGMLRYGIPNYRLPPHVLDAEIERITALGVKLVMNTAVGRDLPLDELNARHDHVYLGIGAQRGLSLNIDGEAGPGVMTAVDYLQCINRGQSPALGKDVVVVGGGNSAIDAARAARRTGARVTLLYRRSLEQMPASGEEVQQAVEESVNMIFLAAPTRIERSGQGNPVAVHAVRMKLGAEDESGRLRPVTVPGSDFRIEATTVIVAISQAPDFSGLEHCAELIDGGRATGEAEATLAGGDVLGLGIAGNAIVQGRYAAERLHCALSGSEADDEARISVLDSSHVELGSRQEKPAVHAAAADVKARLDDPELEVHATITEVQFIEEAARCLSCGSCFGCERCFMYCTAGSFSRLEEPKPGRYFSLNTNTCRECGKCIEVCPAGFLKLG